MKKLEDFNFKKIQLDSIYGGTKEIATNLSEEYCDTLDDANNNGKMDSGECLTIVNCTKK